MGHNSKHQDSSRTSGKRLDDPDLYGLHEQPVREPVDQLRTYLENEQTALESPSWQQLPWHAHRQLQQGGMVVALCLSAILVGFGIVFILERPSFGQADQSEAVVGVASPEGSAILVTPEQEEIRTFTPTMASSPVASPTQSNNTAVPAVQTFTSVAETQPQQSTSSPLISLPPSPASATSTVTETLMRIAGAEAALQSGHFEAVIDYGGGNRSSAQIDFDMSSQPPRFAITSIYEGREGTQTVERITIGEESWQREPDGSWTKRPATEGITDQIRVFLPHAETIMSATFISAIDGVKLQWYDSNRDRAVTLAFDGATGVPNQLQATTRSTGSVLTVVYSSWNGHVDIRPPE